MAHLLERCAANPQIRVRMRLMSVFVGYPDVTSADGKQPNSTELPTNPADPEYTLVLITNLDDDNHRKMLLDRNTIAIQRYTFS